MRWTKVTVICAVMLGMGAVLGCVGNGLPTLSGTPDAGNGEPDAGNGETDAAAPGPCKLGTAVLGDCVLQK